MPVFDPPLLGDESGNYRIHLIGNSGTGKTTLSAYLATKLNIPHIPLDKIAWKPGWQTMPDEEFREEVTALMAEHDTRGWVIDGNYWHVLGTLVPDNATDIIWLDPPLWYYLPRLLWRTFTRLVGLTTPCAEGCWETWEEVFSRKGIVWFCLTNHAVARTRYTEWLSRMGVDVGGKMRRLDESRNELAEWKDEFEHHIRKL